MRRPERGSTLVESAIVTTTFLTLLCGIMQFAYMGFAYNSVCFAAHKAARYAAVHGTASGTVTLQAYKAEVQSAARSYITCLDTSAVSVTVPDTDMNPGSTVTVTVAYNVKPFLVPIATDTLNLQSTSTQMIVQ